MALQPAIFIVDDDADVSSYSRTLLEFAGFANVRSHQSARRFLEEASIHDGDVVLIELRMREYDGFELQRELKRRGLSVAVIMTATHPDVPAVVKAMQIGAVDFIEKPYSNDVLVGSVQRALAVAQTLHHGAARSDDVLRRLDTLTAREREVFDRLVQGWPNKAVAVDLKISQRTVEMHRARILDKMQAQNLATLIRMTIDAGLPLGPERRKNNTKT